VGRQQYWLRGSEQLERTAQKRATETEMEGCCCAKRVVWKHVPCGLLRPASHGKAEISHATWRSSGERRAAAARLVRMNTNKQTHRPCMMVDRARTFFKTLRCCTTAAHPRTSCAPKSFACCWLISTVLMARSCVGGNKGGSGSSPVGRLRRGRCAHNNRKWRCANKPHDLHIMRFKGAPFHKLAQLTENFSKTALHDTDRCLGLIAPRWSCAWPRLLYNDDADSEYAAFT